MDCGKEMLDEINLPPKLVLVIMFLTVAEKNLQLPHNTFHSAKTTSNQHREENSHSQYLMELGNITTISIRNDGVLIGI